jgi:predicted nucleic acid-binding protein
MAEPIIIDTNILTDVSRGNKAVADALNRYVKSGTPVYISRAAYDELVTRAKTPQLGGHYREMLSDMRIQIAPSGAMADRVNFYADNIQHTPAPGKPGQIREYDRKNDPTKPGDAFVVAQTKALNGRLWTLDADVIKRAPQFGVKLAPECSIGGMSGPEDPVKGRQLLGLNPKAIGANGMVLPAGTIGGTAGVYTVTTTGGGGKTSGGGGSAGGTVAYVGVPDNTLPNSVGPSARGEAIVGGIQLAFEGVNFALNLINDHIQKQKVTEALNRIRSAIAKERTENPQKGVLLLFYYTQIQAPEESIIKPGAVFQYVIWGKGPTRDEALQDALSTPTISAGTGRSERKFSQEVWLPPLQKPAITTAKCPFPPVAIGRFFLGNSNKAKFQLVEFNIIGGFDDVVEISIDLPNNTNAEFAILKPPTEVSWFNINGRQKVGVPLKTAKTANDNNITVVDLDPYSPFNAAAAMCFPVDEWAEEVFRTARETDGCRVLAHINFSMIRWVRAKNIHLLRFL